jgi:hypothetical protein
VLLGEKIAFIIGGVAFLVFMFVQIAMIFVEDFSSLQMGYVFVCLLFVACCLLFIVCSFLNFETHTHSIYFTSCVLMGIGGSLMYTAMGSFVVVCSPPNHRGLWNGKKNKKTRKQCNVFVLGMFF